MREGSGGMAGTPRTKEDDDGRSGFAWKGNTFRLLLLVARFSTGAQFHFPVIDRGPNYSPNPFRILLPAFWSRGTFKSGNIGFNGGK